MTTRQEGHDHPEAGSCKVSAAFDALLENDDVVYQTTQIFDALSDFTRFQILAALARDDLSVGELQERGNVSQSAISHQLRLLRDRGLVSGRREGQRTIYSLADDHIRTLIQVGLEHAGEALPEAGLDV
ncbi:MAG: metalloregulator ArsR/SmtB family transcription factor [Atopobiaceae bacterium]|jgi:ArsR family transcriptional regulator|nr:metalloregulator ArsR/SmtB family transcription factor [Atopobiaceae bacterium]